MATGTNDDKLKDITWVNSEKVVKFNLSADTLNKNFEFIRFFILNNPEHIFYLIKNEINCLQLNLNHQQILKI